MNKQSIGAIGVIAGGLFLSLQMYGLKFIQYLEMQQGSFRTHAIDYAREAPMAGALWITAAVILFSAYLLFWGAAEKKNKP
jgi:hypothetical protein